MFTFCKNWNQYWNKYRVDNFLAESGLQSETVHKIVFMNMNFWQCKDFFFKHWLFHSHLQTSRLYKLDCKNYLGFPEQFSNEILTFGSLLQDCLVPTLGLQHHTVEISTQNFEISIESWNPKDTAKVLLNSSKQNHNLFSLSTFLTLISRVFTLHPKITAQNLILFSK